MLIPEAGVHQTSERYFFTPSSLARELFIIQRAVDIISVTVGIHSAIGQKLRWKATTTEISCCFSSSPVRWNLS